jgi:hypothetical protein
VNFRESKESDHSLHEDENEDNEIRKGNRSWVIFFTLYLCFLESFILGMYLEMKMLF